MGEPTQDFLTINIDFGTSNTAAGYTFLDSDQEKRVQVGIFESNNLKWIAFDGGTSQVRSQLAWLSDKEDFLFGKEVDDAINDGLLPETARIQMLKLALEAEDAMVKDVHDDVLEKLDQIHRESGIQFSTLELVAIFLLKILSRIKRMISIARGEDIFKTAKVQYLLSVPALWGLEARSLMIEAAEAAEMFDVKLISEPEAAAFFFMHDRLAEKPGLRDKQEAEGILVLDVGGGTADIITYCAEGGLLDEGAPGTGANCGSALLNKAFRKAFENYVEHDLRGFCQDLRLEYTQASRSAILDIAVAEFERKKRRFNGYRDEAMIININGVRNVPGKGDTDGRISIPSKLISKLFNDKLDIIIQLVREQIQKFNINHTQRHLKISLILFVGGFSASAHAQQRLGNFFGSRGIKFLVPFHDSSNVVSRGGVLRNLHLDSIGWYYLRCSYGVARNESYDPTIHTEAYSEAIHGKSKGKTKTVLDYHDNCEVVEGRIHWLYKYNVRVKAGTRVSVRGWIGAPLHGPISITQILYRSKHETRDSLPVKDPNIDIDVVAKLVWEIDDVEGMGYRERNPRNRRWYQALEYEILMPFDPSSSRVIMIIPDGGKFPDEESWGENFQCREAKVQLAPAVFATPAPVEPGATGQAAASGGPQRNKPRARVRPSESQLGPRRSERQADPHREMLSRVGPYWSGPSRWTTNCGRNA